MDPVGKWTAPNPQRAAEFVMQNSAGHASREIMAEVGKEWSKSDPTGALSFALSKPGELGSALAGSVLAEWGGKNLNEAADWLAKSDASVRNRLSSSFVEAWA